jgi:hypothetical protein
MVFGQQLQHSQLQHSLLLAVAVLAGRSFTAREVQTSLGQGSGEDRHASGVLRNPRILHAGCRRCATWPPSASSR